MLVTIRFYSYFKDLAGTDQMTESLPDGTRLGQLIELIMTRFSSLAPLRKSVLVAVGLDYQDQEYLLKNGDEVSLFPPVQGG
jgi:molybdopterin converting factor small subunit